MVLLQREEVVLNVRRLIDTHTAAPGGVRGKIHIRHRGFESLPQDIKELIEGVAKEVYRDDFKIVQAFFFGRLEFFLRLMVNALDEIECSDDVLRETMITILEQIAEVVHETEVTEADVAWLREIGFLPVDIFKMTVKSQISDIIVELRDQLDEYRMILGDDKYIVNILKMYEGLDKLRRLKSFHPNYDKTVIDFNGSHLSQIVRNPDWEKKLEYFEDPERLKRLTDAGFNGSHLSQIVRNSGWEEKLEIVFTEACLSLLRRKQLTHNGLVSLLKKRDWKEQLKTLGVTL